MTRSLLDELIEEDFEKLGKDSESGSTRLEELCRLAKADAESHGGKKRKNEVSDVALDILKGGQVEDRGDPGQELQSHCDELRSSLQSARAKGPEELKHVHDQSILQIEFALRCFQMNIHFLGQDEDKFFEARLWRTAISRVLRKSSYPFFPQRLAAAALKEKNMYPLSNLLTVDWANIVPGGDKLVEDDLQRIRKKNFDETVFFENQEMVKTKKPKDAFAALLLLQAPTVGSLLSKVFWDHWTENLKQNYDNYNPKTKVLAWEDIYRNEIQWIRTLIIAQYQKQVFAMKKVYDEKNEKEFLRFREVRDKWAEVVAASGAVSENETEVAERRELPTTEKISISDRVRHWDLLAFPIFVKEDVA